MCTASGLFLSEWNGGRTWRVPPPLAVEKPRGSAALLRALLAFPLVPSRRRAGRPWRAAPGVQCDFLPPEWQHCLLETSSFSSEENVNPVRVSLRGFCAPWLAGGRGKPGSLWSLRGGPPAGPEGVPDCTGGVRVATKKDGRSGAGFQSPSPSPWCGRLRFEVDRGATGRALMWG